MPQSNTDSDSIIASSYANSIILSDPALDNIIAEFGTDVVIRNITRSESGEYDDSTETASERRTKAFANSYSTNDDEVKEGLFRAGTITLTFKHADSAYVRPNTEVWLNNFWYKVDRIEQLFSGTDTYIVAVIGRI